MDICCPVPGGPRVWRRGGLYPALNGGSERSEGGEVAMPESICDRGGVGEGSQLVSRGEAESTLEEGEADQADPVLVLAAELLAGLECLSRMMWSSSLAAS